MVLDELEEMRGKEGKKLLQMSLKKVLKAGDLVVKGKKMEIERIKKYLARGIRRGKMDLDKLEDAICERKHYL